MYSTSNGPTLKRSRWLHDRDRDFRRVRLAAALGLQQRRRRTASCRPGASQLRPEIDERAVMVLVRVGDDDAGELRLALQRGSGCRAGRRRRRAGPRGRRRRPCRRRARRGCARGRSRRGARFMPISPTPPSGTKTSSSAACHQLGPAVAAAPKCTSPAAIVRAAPSARRTTSLPSSSIVSKVPRTTASRQADRDRRAEAGGALQPAARGSPRSRARRPRAPPARPRLRRAPSKSCSARNVRAAGGERCRRIGHALRRMPHVHADADHHAAVRPPGRRDRLEQDAGHLGAVDQHVVRPFEAQPACALDAVERQS